VLDFDRPPEVSESDLAGVRKSVGLDLEDLLILQPTRVVPRKGIEHAITVVARLKDPRCRLVVSHESGDEGAAYMKALQETAAEVAVDLRFVQTSAAGLALGVRRQPLDGRLRLSDVYACAQLVTYPSLYEGFGNAFLEAFYFRKPVLINRYGIWIQDIEPKGFRTIAMDGYVAREVVDRVRHILADEAAREEMTEHNYALAKRYFSFDVLRRRLRTLIVNVTGLD
jgi:glycosyltransferase involved in cell wall biosynthesis